MSIRAIESDSQWKITSGSFIYGPNGAVKELIDNSIDGGAQSIFIDIDSKSGGCDYISVRDDGHGIDGADRPLLCLNHTTSKITSLEDISKSSALGFRGEALFMLATLSAEKGSMQVITKTKDDPIGTKWFVDKNGQMKQPSVSKIPSPQGTTIVIRKLLGGLRSRDLEMRSNSRRTLDDIKKMVDHYSLDHRHIRFNLSFVSLKKNGTVAIKTLQQPCNTNISKPRVLSAILHLKKSVSVNFMEFEKIEVNDQVSIEAVLPKMTPESDVVSVKKSLKFVSVNNRAMSLQLPFGKEINKALNSIHRELKLLEPPVWYINLTIDHRIIDINIEPEKNDILLRDQDVLLEDIKKNFRQQLVQEYGMDNEQSENDVLTNNNDATSITPTIDLSGELEMGFVNDVSSSLDANAASHGALFVHDDDSEDGDMSKQHPEASVSPHDDSVPIVSEEGEWTHTFLEKSPSLDLEESRDGDIEKSGSMHLGEYNYDDTTRNNEDLDLSKDMSLSNPFTIAKLTKKRSVPTLPTAAGDSSIETLVSKKRHVSKEAQQKLMQLQQTPPVDKVPVKPIPPIMIRNTRHLAMFSEYTNSLMLPVVYSGESTKHTSERVQDVKSEDSVSQNIQEVLSQRFPAMNNTPHEEFLTTTHNGWCIFNPPQQR